MTFVIFGRTLQNFFFYEVLSGGLTFVRQILPRA